MIQVSTLSGATVSHGKSAGAPAPTPVNAFASSEHSAFKGSILLQPKEPALTSAFDQTVAGKGPLGESGIAICDPCRDVRWDMRWKRMHGWSVFHASSWADLLHNSYGFVPLYLELDGQGDAAGCLPLMEVGSWFLGRRGVSLPFSDSCPVLSSDPNKTRLLLNGALALARRRRWRYLELRGGILPDQDEAAASVRFFQHSLELPPEDGTLFAGFKSELRTAIRKAQKSGLVCEIGNSLELVKEFYEMHVLTRRKRGVPPQPFSFFGNFHKYILDCRAGVIVLARKGAKPVAGAVFMHTHDTAVFKYGASDPDELGNRPNDLVIWEGLRWCILRGISLFDMGRTSVANQGLRRFKLAWGTSEQTLCYYRMRPADGGILRSVDRSVGLINHGFRYLPKRVLRMVGGMIYRHLD